VRKIHFRLKAVIVLERLKDSPTIYHYGFHTSVAVSVYMTARFLSFSNATQHAMHPGQNWVLKFILRWPPFKN